MELAGKTTLEVTTILDSAQKDQLQRNQQLQAVFNLDMQKLFRQTDIV
jgi:hypothetical protein